MVANRLRSVLTNESFRLMHGVGESLVVRFGHEEMHVFGHYDEAIDLSVKLLPHGFKAC
jgi:hypothetical protein